MAWAIEGTAASFSDADATYRPDLSLSISPPPGGADELSDPSQTNEQERLAGTFVANVLTKGRLKHGLDNIAAAETMSLYMTTDNFHRLVGRWAASNGGWGVPCARNCCPDRHRLAAPNRIHRLPDLRSRDSG